MALKRVVLPAPLEPIRPVTPPAGISNDTPSTAFTPPNATAASRTIKLPFASEDAKGAKYCDSKGAVPLSTVRVFPSSEPFFRFFTLSPSHSNIPTSPSGAINVKIIRVPPYMSPSYSCTSRDNSGSHLTKAAPRTAPMSLCFPPMINARTTMIERLTP